MKDLCRNPTSMSPAGFAANRTSQRRHVWNTNTPAAFATRRWSSVAACANKDCVQERDAARMQIKGRRMANGQANETAIKTDGQFIIILLDVVLHMMICKIRPEHCASGVKWPSWSVGGHRSEKPCCWASWMWIFPQNQIFHSLVSRDKRKHMSCYFSFFILFLRSCLYIKTSELLLLLDFYDNQGVMRWKTVSHGDAVLRVSYDASFLIVSNVVKLKLIWLWGTFWTT